MFEVLTNITNITGEFIGSIIIILFSLIIATITKLIFGKYIKLLTKKTKTDIDDVFLKIITKPIYIGILLTGFYLGIRVLTHVQDYIFYLDTIYFIIIVLLVSRI
ncbi:MAG TPA: hypothetical protein EYP80_00970, partial [Candidatus Aenigmarchaeota archaeon]|nr:hypothetical protein [Candidatus Aenigmarchaeota archaeon]